MHEITTSFACSSHGQTNARRFSASAGFCPGLWIRNSKVQAPAPTYRSSWRRPQNGLVNIESWIEPLYYLYNSLAQQTMRLWNRNPSFRLRFHHQRNFRLRFRTAVFIWYILEAVNSDALILCRTFRPSSLFLSLLLLHPRHEVFLLEPQIHCRCESGTFKGGDLTIVRLSRGV